MSVKMNSLEASKLHQKCLNGFTYSESSLCISLQIFGCFLLLSREHTVSAFDTWLTEFKRDIFQSRPYDEASESHGKIESYIIILYLKYSQHLPI